MAVSARSVARFTSDLDFAVAVDGSEEAERIVAALVSRGYAVASLLEDKNSGDIATVRLECPPHSAAPLLCDLLFSTSGIEREIVAEATMEVVLPRLSLPVARTGHLIAMKVLAERDNREHDIPDLARLIEVADEAEMARARSALAAIQSRGFARGKDLLPRLDELLERFRMPGA